MDQLISDFDNTFRQTKSSLKLLYNYYLRPEFNTAQAAILQQNAHDNMNKFKEQFERVSKAVWSIIPTDGTNKIKYEYLVLVTSL